MVQVGYSPQHFPTLGVSTTPTSKHPTSSICRGGTHPASQSPRLRPSKSPFPSVEEEASDSHMAMCEIIRVNPSPILVKKLQHEMLELEGLRKHLFQLCHEGTEAQEGGDLIPHKAAPNYYTDLLQQQGAWVNEG